jgi:hypothetical protein
MLSAQIVLVFLQILSQAVTVAPLAFVLLEHGSVAISNFLTRLSPTGGVLLPVPSQADTHSSALSETGELGNVELE